MPGANRLYDYFLILTLKSGALVTLATLQGLRSCVALVELVNIARFHHCRKFSWAELGAEVSGGTPGWRGASAGPSRRPGRAAEASLSGLSAQLPVCLERVGAD